MNLFRASDVNVMTKRQKKFHFQFISRPVCCWKYVEKNLHVFMHRCDGTLHVRVTASVVRIVPDVISFRLLLFLLLVIVAVVYGTVV